MSDITKSSQNLITCVIFESVSLGGQYEDDNDFLPNIVAASDDPTKPTVHAFEPGVAQPLIERGRAVELSQDMDIEAAAKRLRLKGQGKPAKLPKIIDALTTLLAEHAEKHGPVAASSTKDENPKPPNKAKAGDSGDKGDKTPTKEQKLTEAK